MRKEALLIDGHLAFIDEHSSPRRVVWPDGVFVTRSGEPVLFTELLPLGEEHTQAYGWLRNYKVPKQ